ADYSYVISSGCEKGLDTKVALLAAVEIERDLVKRSVIERAVSISCAAAEHHIGRGGGNREFEVVEIVKDVYCFIGDAANRDRCCCGRRITLIVSESNARLNGQRNRKSETQQI